MAKKSKPLLVEVKSTEMVTPNLRRIIFSSDQLADYPDETAGLHIKAFIPKTGQDKPVLPKISPEGRPVWPAPEEKPYVRAYSVSYFDKDTCDIGIDFVMHKKGPASQWAANAKIGDYFGLSRSGGPETMVAEGDFYLFAGDLSALPAMRVLLSRLPEDAKGVAFILTPAETDRVLLDIKSSEFEVKWLIGDKSDFQVLSKEVSAWDWPESKVSAWVAGESTEVLGIRKYLKTKGLSTKDYYAIPYWKLGESEEMYHAERHDIMEEIT